MLRRNGQVLRYLTSAAQRDWVSLSSTKSFKAFTDSGELVATEPTTKPTRPALTDPWVTVLRHQTIPVVSYPYEWCFSMLQDVALLQIDLLLAALDEGMTLKDATPFNIQWIGTRPVFIDIGSFTAAAPGEPWAGYRQFCETFLYPLFLQVLQGRPVSPMAPGQPRRRGGGVHQPSHVGARSPSSGSLPACVPPVQAPVPLCEHPPQRPKGSARGRVHRGADHAQREAHAAPRRTADVAPRAVDLVGVRRRHHIRSDRSRAQEAVCPSGSPIAPPACVWDLGCNTGEYSRAVRACADRVIAVDADHLAIDRLYRALKGEHDSTILPLVGNLTDPSQGLGWRHQERQTLEARSRPDLILALALIHHLSIGRNVPLPEVVAWFASFEADVVIEFVAPQDAMVAQLVRNRDALASGYTQDRFEACVAEHFVIAATERLQSGTRTMCYVRPKHAS